MKQTFARLSALDRFFLDIESEATPMHMGAVLLFEEAADSARPISLNRLRAHVETRLDSIPRYRQRLMQVPLEGHPVWVDAQDFRIADHVRGVSLPQVCSFGQLEETVSWIFSQPLSRERPLWEIWLIDGLPRGGFALACKTHHCLTDGLGGAALLCAILETQPFSPPGKPPAWQPRPLPDASELLGEALRARGRGALSLATAAVQNGAGRPADIAESGSALWSAVRTIAAAAWQPPTATAFDRPTGSDRRFLWWSMPLEEAKQGAHALGGTVNDVALTLLSDALVRSSAIEADGSGRPLRVLCPVGSSASAASLSKLGNCVSGVLVDLPTEAIDLRARWERVRAATTAQKDSGAAQGTSLLATLADTVGPSLLSQFEALTRPAQAYNLVMTNVPGPRFPLYLFERRLTGVCPLVPLLRGQGLGVALFSYAGKLTWGFHVDASRLQEARRLRTCLSRSAREFLQLVGHAPSSADSRANVTSLSPYIAERDRVAIDREAVSATG